jgi:iron complex outermembrane recepter protein
VNGAPQLSAVVVTAERREETAQKVPTAVSVLGGDYMTDNQIGRSASEVLNYVPNASAVAQGHGRPRWWIRGVGTGQQQIDFSNPVGFYLDDVYIGNASATGFPLFDLDRVEVLRGPQGTLWGKNTTGGAINVLSRKPDFNGFDGYARVDDGSYNDRIFEGAAGGTIWQDRLAARVAFHYEARGGRFQDLYSGQSAGQFQDGALRMQLLGKITPDLELLANVHFRHYGTQGAATTTSSNATNGTYLPGYVPSTNTNVVDSNAPSSDNQTQNGAFLNLKWQKKGYTVTAISAYEDWRDQALTDTDDTPIEISRGWTQAQTWEITEELRVASPREQRLSWIAGLFYYHENIVSDTASGKLPGQSLEGAGPANYAHTSFEQWANSGAAFGSATLKILDNVNVTGGLRFTTETRRLNYLREATPGGAAASYSDTSQWWLPSSVNTPLTNWFQSSPSNTWNNVSGDVTPQWQITKQDQIYFRFAHGVKSGGYNTAATTLQALNVVQPESLDDFEFGAKTGWLNNRLTVNASAFHYNYHNVQVNVVGPLPPTNTAVSYLQNAAEGRVNGAEFEVNALPLRDLHVAENLGLLDTKYTNFETPGGTSYAGNQFVRSPHVNSILIADYRIPLGSEGAPRLVIAGDWHYTSRQFDYATNQSDPLLQTPPYSIFNARVAVTTADEKLSLTFYSDNISDVRVRLHSLPGAAGATGDVAIWGDPRIFGVSLVGRWW